MTAGNVGLCTWYEDEHCCNFTAAQANDLEEGTKFLGLSRRCNEISLACRLHVEMWTCGRLCSPDQGNWMAGATVTSCKDFAESFYNACRNDEFSLSATEKDGECKGVKDEWSDGIAFLEADEMGAGKVVNGTDNCFNSAPRLAGPVGAISVALLVWAFTSR
jgi:Folate receptor family